MSNGTFIADIAYEKESYKRKYIRVGSILYFRSHDCKVKVLGRPPANQNIIGKFKKSEKVPDAPMIEGDLFYKKHKVGHIHSQQNEYGETLYWLRLTVGLPEEGTNWLRVELEDK